MRGLEIKNLTVEVAGKKVVDGMNLTIPAGEVHAIMGPNGTGKSSLSKAIAGHPEYPITSGEVLLDGEAQGNLLPARIPGGDTVWMLATGSGLAPFIAMTGDEGTLGAWKKHILVIGARTREEVDRLAAYAESEARIPLTILTAASREAGELTGRIPALIESGALEAKAGAAFTPESARLLLCGNPDFIRETRALMKARGIVSPRLGKPGQLLVESLW